MAALSASRFVALHRRWSKIRDKGALDAYVRRTLVRAAIDESRRPWRREHAAEVLPKAAPDTAGSDAVGDSVATRSTLLAHRGTVASGPASEVPERCPAGSRATAVPVTGGVLYVLLVPLVEPEPVAPAAPDVPRQDAATPEGARSYSVTLDGGRTLTVIWMPGTPGEPAPLADEVPDLARELAAAL